MSNNAVNGDREVVVRQLASLVADLPVAAAYLFGSQVTGTTHADSDVDVALVAVDQAALSDSLLDEFRVAVAGQLGVSERRVDVSRLSDLPLSLRFAIHRDGMVLGINDAAAARQAQLRDAALYHDQYPFIKAANRRFADTVSKDL